MGVLLPENVENVSFGEKMGVYLLFPVMCIQNCVAYGTFTINHKETCEESDSLMLPPRAVPPS